jgi:TRAP-type C4-dicarboxylate transport system permease small subunit
LLKLFDNFVSLLATITRVVCILMTMALFAIVIAAIVARYGFGQAVS